MAVSHADVKNLFTKHGVRVSTSNESEDSRVRRITNEINSGRRTLSQIEESIVYQGVGDTFDRHNVDMAANGETAAQRRRRIVNEVLGGRPMSGVDRSVRYIANQGSGGGGEPGEDEPDPEDAEGGNSPDRSGDAWAVLAEVLSRYGLESMAPWVKQEIQQGRSIQEILLDMREHSAFKERFKAIDRREELGLNPVSPEEIIAYENQARDLMRSSGLPSGFYDEFDDFVELIGKGVSLPSLQRRVQESWDRVVNAPPEVKSAFGELYGVQGDQALATFMFDPDKAEVQLKKMAKAAVAGGAMNTFGFGLDASAAARVSGFDLNDQAVRQGFGRLAQLQNVFRETLGERDDLRWQDEGVNAIFDGGEGASAIDRRIQTRRNEFAGGGGALLDQTGIAGIADR